MKKISIQFIVLAVFALAVSCSQSKSNVEKLTSHEWHLDEIIYADSNYTITVPPDVTLIFSDSTNAVAGRGGCNSFFGTYSVTEDGNLKIDLAGRTLAFCMHMDFEDRYIGLLNDVRKYTATKDHLKLTTEDAKTTLSFKPSFSEQ